MAVGIDSKQPILKGKAVEEGGDDILLLDVVAYVEVWSSNKTENYSQAFARQLSDLGAKISKCFNKEVTHVVFKDGHQRTWNKAKRTDVKLVSVLWVEKCREAATHIDESSFPAINANDGLLVPIKRKHKCMQPKDFIEKTPENDRRLQKRLDKMVKELDVQKATVESDIPVLLFDEDASLIYSPKPKITDCYSAMEKRIKEMKNKRENLSPTASQMMAETCSTTFGSPVSICKPLFDCTTPDSSNAAFQDVQNTISTCGTYDLCDTFKKQRERYDESKKKVRAKKPTRSLVMTSMPSEKQDALIQVVNKFGGFLFSDSVCETTTHVVAGNPRRTLNVMLGIARGCWIVSADWVLCSLDHGRWIPEEPYELSEHFPASSICRLQRHLSAGEFRHDLFSNQLAMFISLSSEPPCHSLTELVQLCGGKVCKTVRHAKVYIGDCTGKKHPEIKYLSEKWILDSITQHRICPVENYLLTK
ncbi:microcephalin isoform X9 [Rhinatrema bivittatum]|uniref:microcephalin isoform X9 n=1 Tax=Rhinatrema bivittatum TaxID=194408 RepID=UPI00112E5D3D|nr:microcephalin isoform X9 [Rhinatrema bivittatum]